MVLSKNKGFSLIELMIVIAIIGILVAVALPQFASMSEDAKKTKAKQDCDTIVQAVTRYNALEGVALKSLDELAGKYITNIKELKDPWGNAYQINTGSGFVFSQGPDGQSPSLKSTQTGYSADKATGKDDIKVPFIGELMLTDALLAIDVGPSGTSGETADSLTLVFNKTVALCDRAGVLIGTTGHNYATAPTVADFEPGGGIFDWYVGTPSEANHIVTSTTVTAYPRILDKGATAGGQTLRMYASKDDSREVIIDIGVHSLNGIVPNYHHINITTGTGAARYFYEDGADPTTATAAADQKPAKPAGVACKIRRE
jgi:prepilin-type N-terminal cleavage/methylation domain-containing protein